MSDQELDNFQSEPCSRIPFRLLTPIMRPERYSEASGLRPPQVRGQIERNHIASIKIGGYRCVNLVRMAWDDIVETQEACLSVTEMAPELFGKLSGFDDGAVKALLAKGHLPEKMIGRLRVVDTAALYRICAEASEQN